MLHAKPTMDVSTEHASTAASGRTWTRCLMRSSGTSVGRRTIGVPAGRNPTNRGLAGPAERRTSRRRRLPGLQTTVPIPGVRPLHPEPSMSTAGTGRPRAYRSIGRGSPSAGGCIRSACCCRARPFLEEVIDLSASRDHRTFSFRAAGDRSARSRSASRYVARSSCPETGGR